MKKGNLDEVRQSIVNKSKINSSFRVIYGNSMFENFDSFFSRMPKFVIRLLGHYPETNYYPLMYAAKENQLEVVKLLLENGADVSINNDDGLSALYYAIFMGNEKIAKLLIDYGCDINKENSRGSPLFTASGRSNMIILNLLLQNGAKVNHKRASGRLKGKTPLDRAIISKNNGVADLLRKSGAKTTEELKAAQK